MKLLDLAPSNPTEHHKTTEARVYSSPEEAVHLPRLIHAHNLLEEAIQRARHEFRPSDRQPLIVELGCGTGDICGPHVKHAEVVGFDVNPAAIRVAKQRFPGGMFVEKPIENVSLLGADCDILVMCEVLEHLEDPLQRVKVLGPQAKFMLVSHPLDEALNSDISGGEHRWSFDMDDFHEWFRAAGHRLLKTGLFQMGMYRMVIGLGRRTS